jgi:hypothetical protein
MREVSESMVAIAEAVKANVGDSIEKVVKDTADSTLEGQAQAKVLEDSYLTEDGQLFVFKLMGDNTTLARSYLTIYYKKKLRGRWLKNTITDAGGNLEELFIEWEE